MELKPADLPIFVPRAEMFVRLGVLDLKRNLASSQGHRL